ncbi:MAG: hypothetical protein M0C28_38910 [Candidatus Moduliflexus flocculans]|nr:hypothetical protein [Candidatus Moduliflexus flocculans]
MPAEPPPQSPDRRGVRPERWPVPWPFSPGNHRGFIVAGHLDLRRHHCSTGPTACWARS